MIGRIAYWAVLAAVALVATGAELDRSSRFAPQLSAYVPGPFRGFAAQRLAEIANAGGDADAAIDASRQLLRVRPVPAENLTLASWSYALAGDNERSLAALEEAARRGWREPLAQLAAARAGLISGNYPSAAQRVAALMALGVLNDETDQVLAQLLEQVGGRDALAEMMAGTGHFVSGFPARLARVGTPAQFADTMRRASGKGARIDCERLQVISQQYGQAGADEMAGLRAAVGCEP